MANTTITVQGLQVPTLVDNSIWFMNAAAWNSYWLQAGFNITMTVAAVGQYGLMQAANTIVFVPGAIPAPLNYQVQSTDNVGSPQMISVPDANYVNEIAAQLTALLADYVALKTALQTAGIINNV